MKIQWEYNYRDAIFDRNNGKVAYEVDLSALNALGEDGWEIVSEHIVIQDGEPLRAQATFKRPKEMM